MLDVERTIRENPELRYRACEIVTAFGLVTPKPVFSQFLPLGKTGYEASAHKISCFPIPVRKRIGSFSMDG